MAWNDDVNAIFEENLFPDSWEDESWMHKPSKLIGEYTISLGILTNEWAIFETHLKSTFFEFASELVNQKTECNHYSDDTETKIRNAKNSIRRRAAIKILTADLGIEKILQSFEISLKALDEDKNARLKLAIILEKARHIQQFRNRITHHQSHFCFRDNIGSYFNWNTISVKDEYDSERIIFTPKMMRDAASDLSLITGWISIIVRKPHLFSLEKNSDPDEELSHLERRTFKFDNRSIIRQSRPKRPSIKRSDQR